MADQPVTPARPMGITVVAAVQVIIGVIDLIVARDYIYWSDWRFGRNDSMWGLVDGGLAIVFLVLAVGYFVAATRMWAVGPDAWWQSVRLLAAQIALILLSIALWQELSALDISGLIVSTGALVYLNLTGVRALFGRGPLFETNDAAG